VITIKNIHNPMKAGAILSAVKYKSKKNVSAPNTNKRIIPFLSICEKFAFITFIKKKKINNVNTAAPEKIRGVIKSHDSLFCGLN